MDDYAYTCSLDGTFLKFHLLPCCGRSYTMGTLGFTYAIGIMVSEREMDADKNLGSPAQAL